MLTHKQSKKINKQILKDNNYDTDRDYVSIDVTIEKKSQLFSSYNYDDDTLNKELGEYLYEKAKPVPMNKDIVVKVYTDLNVESKQIRSAIKSNLKSDYIETKELLKQVNNISIATFFVGLLFIALMFLFETLKVHFILTTVVEVMAWVFMWESVDCFAFKRTGLRRELKKIQKLYSAKVKILNDEE